MSELTDRGAWTIPDTAVHEVEHGGRSWTVTVAQPQPAPADDVRTRVIYVLDPVATLGSAVQIARTTHLLTQGALPALLVVGIGPTGEDFHELSRLRNLDLTPTKPDAATVEQAAAFGIEYGGADAFLDVIVDVIAPQVEQRYQGDPSDRTLAGWSLGGLTAAHALLTRTESFRRYLMVSPSLWWADHSLLDSMSLRGTPGALDVYLTVGDLEESSWNRLWPPLPDGIDRSQIKDSRMVTNMRTLAAALRAQSLPGVSVHDEVLRGEHHNTLWAAAFTRGMLALHASDYRVDG